MKNSNQSQKFIPSGSISSFEDELKDGERFRFGENWKQLLSVLNEKRIFEAELSLKQMLEIDNMQGLKFLDVGSGSGLFSLAAKQLGASVHSFDIDPSSVWCTNEFRSRYFPKDENWVVERGSVLDSNYLKSLGEYDIVYSWGVLHHSGDMWKALKNIVQLVIPGGKLFIALYNDQGILSNIWKLVKRSYNYLPKVCKPIILYPVGLLVWGPIILKDFLKFQPFQSWKSYYHSRGMSPWRDVVDWVGGYPYEVAKPKDVISFYEQYGFSLQTYIPIGKGSGNNQYVFIKNL